MLDAHYTDILLGEKVPTGRRLQEGYAYGFFTEKVNGHWITGHAGSVAGFNAWFDMYHDLGYVAVVLSNYSPPSAQQVGEKVRTLLALK